MYGWGVKLKKPILLALVLLVLLSYWAFAATPLGSTDRPQKVVITREGMNPNGTKNLNLGAETTDVTKLANRQFIFGTAEGGRLNITNIAVDVERWIEVTNQGTESANLTGWSLTNQANSVYAFPAIDLAPGAAVKVRDGMGQDSQTDLFTNQSQPFVNQTGDVVSLLDAAGTEIASYEIKAQAAAAEAAGDTRNPQMMPVLVTGKGIGEDKNPSTAPILLDNTSGRPPELMPILINKSSSDQRQ